MKIDYTYGLPSGKDPMDLEKTLGDSTNNEERYDLLVELMKLGRFEFRRELFELTKCESRLARKSFLLYSEVVSNDHLAMTLPVIESNFETDFLGLTAAANSSLSLSFVSVLISQLEDVLSMAEDQRDSEVVEDLFDSIQNITGAEDGQSIDSIRNACDAISRNTDGYIWGGRPVNVQLIFDEFVSCARESMLNQSQFFFRSSDVKVLSLFTGTPLLVEGGSVITQSDIDCIQSYGESVVGDRWEVGKKYFYGHDVG